MSIDTSQSSSNQGNLTEDEVNSRTVGNNSNDKNNNPDTNNYSSDNAEEEAVQDQHDNNVSSNDDDFVPQPPSLNENADLAHMYPPQMWSIPIQPANEYWQELDPSN